MDADDELGVDIPRIEAQHLLVVTTGLQSDMERGDKAPFDQADVHRAQAARPAPREECVDILRVLAQPLLGKIHCLCKQQVNLFGHRRIGSYRVLSVKKPVVRIESSVEEIEAIQLAEDDRIEHIIHGKRTGGILRLDFFEPRQRAIVIEDVEALIGLAHQRVQVEGVSIYSRGRGYNPVARGHKKHQKHS